MPTLERVPVVVAPRFSGFPGLAHGGHVAGLLASALGAGAAEVRLRRPVRTRRPLTLDHLGEDAVALRDGTALLATAEAAPLAIELPAPVGLADAQAAAARFPGRERHLFPRCFGCGQDHPRGLRLCPGPVAGRPVVAAPWVPAGRGAVPVERVWAAFDCPQLWALIAHAPAGTADRVVTAALAARIDGPVIAGRPHVVMAWPVGRTARGWIAGAALLGPDGSVRAVGRQVAAVASWGVPLDRRRWAGRAA
jgi:hypothetical protein